MKERPILMHARSINGILEGRKTQTRRIIKTKHSLEDLASPHAHNIRVTELGIKCDWFGGVMSYPVRNPYGQPGDRLWIREAWYADIEGAGSPADVFYRASARDLAFVNEIKSFKWKPSIHMPRWASRLTLEITGIRVERVQDISEEDAKAEGCPLNDEATGCADDLDGSYVKAFSILWDSTNGKGAWERNDWCWIVDFRRLP